MSIESRETDAHRERFLLRLSWPGGAVAGHAKGAHWGARAKATKALRLEAATEAMARGLNRRRWPAAKLVLTYHPPGGLLPQSLPDVQNMPARCKAMIDGIADAMGCDDRKFRVHYPPEFAATIKGGCVMIEVSEC